jgi:hypothetical protein
MPLKSDTWALLGQRLSNDASDATICPYWAKRRIRPQGATGNTRAETRHPLGPLEFACDTRRCRCGAIVGGIHTSPSTLLVRADDVIGLQIMNQLGTSRSLTECEKYQLTRRSPARGISTERLDSIL